MQNWRCLTAAGVISAGASELQMQRALWQMWQVLGDDYPPFIIDKFMFLVGSGPFEKEARLARCHEVKECCRPVRYSA